MQTHCLSKSWGSEPASDASLIPMTPAARAGQWIVGDSRQGDGLSFEVRVNQRRMRMMISLCACVIKASHLGLKRL